jgi:hypothetical protein
LRRASIVGRLPTCIRRVMERPSVRYLLGEIFDSFQLRLKK